MVDHGRLKAALAAARSPPSLLSAISSFGYRPTSRALPASARVRVDRVVFDADALALALAAVARTAEASVELETVAGQMMRQMAEMATELSARNVSTALWACAKAGAQMDAVAKAAADATDAVAKRATRSAHTEDARGVATMLHAFAAYASRAPPLKLLECFDARAPRAFATATTHDAAVAAWSIAKLRQRHGLRPSCNMLEALWTCLRSAADSARVVPTRDVAMSVQALGVLASACDAETFRGLAKEARAAARALLVAAAPRTSAFGAQELAHVLWGTARHDEESPADEALGPLAEPFAEAAVKKVRSESGSNAEAAHAASTCAWSCARLKALCAKGLAASMRDAALSHVPWMNASDLGELAWAHGHLAWAYDDARGLPDALLDRADALARVGELTWRCCGLLEYAARACRDSQDATKRTIKRLSAHATADAARATALADSHAEAASRNLLNSASWKEQLGGVREARVLVADPSPGGAQLLASALRASGARVTLYNRYADVRVDGVPLLNEGSDADTDAFDAVFLCLPRGRGAAITMAKAAAASLRSRSKRKRNDEGSRSVLFVYSAPDASEETDAVVRASFREGKGVPMARISPGAWSVEPTVHGVGAQSVRLHELFGPVMLEDPIALPQPDGGAAVEKLKWYTVADAGLFAGGAVDPMTRMFVSNLPRSEVIGRRHAYWRKQGEPGRRLRVADIACGSGVIAAAVRHGRDDLDIVASDYDRAAVAAAARNLAAFTAGVRPKAVHADGVGDLDGAFDVILSNPPVHVGAHDSFRVLRSLLCAAPDKLHPRGELWLVAQSYVPVGLLASADGRWRKCRALASDGAFVVWRLGRR